MSYQNILVLTDFSKDSDETVRAAVEFAGKYDAKMTILTGSTAEKVLRCSPISVFVTRR